MYTTSGLCYLSAGLNMKRKRCKSGAGPGRGGGKGDYVALSPERKQQYHSLASKKSRSLHHKSVVPEHSLKSPTTHTPRKKGRPPLGEAALSPKSKVTN